MDIVNRIGYYRGRKIGKHVLRTLQKNSLPGSSLRYAIEDFKSVYGDIDHIAVSELGTLLEKVKKVGEIVPEFPEGTALDDVSTSLKVVAENAFGLETLQAKYLTARKKGVIDVLDKYNKSLGLLIRLKPPEREQATITAGKMLEAAETGVKKYF